MAIEIVEFPIEVVVMFYSYVSHYQRVCWDMLGWDVDLRMKMTYIEVWIETWKIWEVLSTLYVITFRSAEGQPAPHPHAKGRIGNSKP